MPVHLDRPYRSRESKSLAAAYVFEAGLGSRQFPQNPARNLRDFRFVLDRAGRQHFNFVQWVWVDPLVPMAFTRSRTLALETLALNIITLAQSREAVFEGPLRGLVKTFCDECLLGAPEEAWVMPRATVRLWIASLSAKFDAVCLDRSSGCGMATPGASQPLETAERVLRRSNKPRLIRRHEP